MIDTSPIIKPSHLRSAGLCVPGTRKWLDRYNWTMADFRHGRISAQMLRQTGDAIVARVADIAEGEVNGV